MGHLMSLFAPKHGNSAWRKSFIRNHLCLREIEREKEREKERDFPTDLHDLS